ncbi:GerAB/ArcD/ProY family transporter [Thermaerobacter subterraneus]|uniref:Spore germination protein n=1 Tax=Thermaerobacter subterraneus DSM 13965 TaxID=867903 RepID=K6Q2M4_9FIRM|nr:GerAB/ArcD/ProY family transporter [Thermaerobacter subterraneus]EKP95279.1 Spore germination protein [Thermaerobacter subterraneus DSM 13965]
MPRRDQVDPASIAALLIVVVLATLAFFLPRSLAAVAGRDAWLAVLASTPVVALVVGAWYALYFRPGLTPLDRLRFHPLMRWLVLPVLVAYATYHAGGILGETVLLMVVVFPETPVWAFHATMALTTWVLVAYGRETLARMGLLVLPVMVLALVTNLLILLPGDAEWAQLLPLLEGGAGPLLRGIPVMVAATAETLILTYFADGLSSRHGVLRPLMLAAAGMVVLLAGVALAGIVVLGPGETARAVAPTFILARLARPVPVMSRPEVFTISAWLLGIALKLALFVYAAGVTARAGLGLTERWQGPVHGLMTLAAVAVAAILFPDTERWDWQFTRVWPLVAMAGLVAGLVTGLLPAWPGRAAARVEERSPGQAPEGMPAGRHRPGSGPAPQGDEAPEAGRSAAAGREPTGERMP